jgi:small subunit ribosomal protein S20
LPVKKKSLSVVKNVRQSERRRLRNRGRKLRLKKALKQFKAAGTRADATKLLPDMQAIVDKSARRGIIHRNTAARIKSKLARRAGKLA